ncbi:unnamed protein product [Musa acuminata subsp. malaccensis]|uniref:(wild Malaysian banana) hypothetical protein n=1 Tax=Musa acuminata subsp. malaccensis TaxID=214687 RepID=A0A804IKX1_MUSAM|nr:unnamed protein product [Musa acuminata subsp. malaccensis]
MWMPGIIIFFSQIENSKLMACSIYFCNFVFLKSLCNWKASQHGRHGRGEWLCHAEEELHPRNNTKRSTISLFSTAYSGRHSIFIHHSLILLLIVPDDADLAVELKTSDRQTNLRSVLLHQVEDAGDVHVNLRAALESKPHLGEPSPPRMPTG